MINRHMERRSTSLIIREVQSKTTVRTSNLSEGLLWKRQQNLSMHMMCTYVCSVKSLQSCPTLWDPMDYTHQAPLFMGFSRQECWSGLPFPPPGELPDPGTDPHLPFLLGFFLAAEGGGYSSLRCFSCCDSQALEHGLSGGDTWA